MIRADLFKYESDRVLYFRMVLNGKYNFTAEQMAIRTGGYIEIRRSM